MVIGLVICVTLIGLAAGVNAINNPIVIDTEVEDLEVTIYNTNLGVVKEYRATYLPAGVINVLYEGVASRIDPTSVRLKAVDSVIEVVEQSYQYDLVNKEKILKNLICMAGLLSQTRRAPHSMTPRLSLLLEMCIGRRKRL